MVYMYRFNADWNDLVSESMRQYADLPITSMRQFAVRASTHTRHPAVYAVCTKGDELTL